MVSMTRRCTADSPGVWMLTALAGISLLVDASCTVAASVAASSVVVHFRAGPPSSSGSTRASASTVSTEASIVL